MPALFSRLSEFACHESAASSGRWHGRTLAIVAVTSVIVLWSVTFQRASADDARDDAVQPAPKENKEFSDKPLADAAIAVLARHCKRCHHDDPQVVGLDVLNRDSLIAVRQGLDPYIAAGEPDNSLLWQSIESDFMPYDNKSKLSDAEKSTLRRWIEEGAPFPNYPRESVDEFDVLIAISNHLRVANREDRPFLRFFSFHPQWNNRDVPDSDLAFLRAGLSKLLNCVSWKPEISLPEAIDEQGIIFVIDIRDFARNAGKSLEIWRGVRTGYPYGISPRDADGTVDRVFAELSSLTADGASVLPYFRADWFVANASRPPRYDALLELPASSAELEKLLSVNVAENFRQGRLQRAGFHESGVSSQSRVVERHDSVVGSGAYWKSYDFFSKGERSNPFRFPLGPPEISVEFPDNAFKPAGSEIIFSLPNGLHGYLVVNADDKRIDEAPIDVVWDRNSLNGNPLVVNGLSCIGCHKHGIRPFADRIRRGADQMGSRQKTKILDIYVDAAAMEKSITRDTQAYLTALEAATSVFLPNVDNIRLVGEPVTMSVQAYQRDLDLNCVAAELGIDAEVLRVHLRTNHTLLQLGLGALVQPGGRIGRDAWEARIQESGRSVYQSAAFELGRGAPIDLN